MPVIDWPLTITTIKDVLLGIASAVAAYVAHTGLKRWQLELRGKAAFDTARALARATYKLRDEITICRSPFVFAHEFPSSYNETTRHTPEQEVEGWGHVYDARMKSVWTAVQDFDAQSLEAEALWGEAARQKTQALRACVAGLHAAIQAFVDDKREGDFKHDKEFRERMLTTMNDFGNSRASEFSQRFASAIKDMEEMLLPHLARIGTSPKQGCFLQKLIQKLRM